MASVLDEVDKRTNLVGQNRLEVLMFRLQGRQLFGINVFKVQEVLPCPRLTELPQSHSSTRGLAIIRNRTIPVLDLAVLYEIKKYILYLKLSIFWVLIIGTDYALFNVKFKEAEKY